MAFVTTEALQKFLERGDHRLEVFLPEIWPIRCSGPPGRRDVQRSLDWICVSPKAGTEIRQTSGQELKLVYPQAAALPERFENLEFEHFFLQPMDGPDRTRNTKLAIEYCLEHPRWRVSLQTHKLMGIP